MTPPGQLDPKEVLGRLVNARRRALGYTQSGLASRGGPSTATLYLIEDGRAPNLQRATRDSLDEVLQWQIGTTTAIMESRWDAVVDLLQNKTGMGTVLDRIFGSDDQPETVSPHSSGDADYEAEEADPQLKMRRAYDDLVRQVHTVRQRINDSMDELTALALQAAELDQGLMRLDGRTALWKWQHTDPEAPAAHVYDEVIEAAQRRAYELFHTDDPDERPPAESNSSTRLRRPRRASRLGIAKPTRRES